MEDVWKKVLSEIQLEVSGATFATLFKKTALLTLEKNIATVSCSSSMVSNLIETRYYSLLKKALDKHLGQSVSLVFTTAGFPRETSDSQKNLGPLFVPQIQAVPEKKSGLSSFSTFENFAVSTTNQLAFAATQTVAQKLATTYNPLFIYGGVGVGKTHLMQAIGNCVLEHKPKTKIIYCMGEEFVNEIIFAIRNRDTKSFKDKFRNTQVLLIDDIQFIAGKDTVQEEFFHTFNAITRGGGQIVLTSDKPPSEIKKLEARLVSRFEGGLTVDIEPPDFGLRTAIILIKAKLRGIDISIDVAKILAANIEDIRKLEGALIRLATEAQVRNIPLDEELATKISGGTKPPKEEKRITKDDLLRTLCFFYNLKPTHFKSPQRNKFIALPRHVLMYLLRKELQLPLTEIGDFLGGRDHTTIMYGVSKIEGLLSRSLKMKEELMGIKKIIYEHS